MNPEKVIIGIDPGTSVLGYGVIEIAGKSIKILAMGIVDLKKYDNHYIKLQKIFERVRQLVDTYNPDEMAIEAPFFGKNVQSMLKLGRAQGVAMTAALTRNIPIFEYAPLRIKQAITGNGSASKEQVAAMLQHILNFKDIPKYLDATDGLAAAVCHHFQSNTLQSGKTVKNWKDFISKNPDKLRG
ncbi:MAG: crossover junction endodeoxyribonuclease RuvC [Marinilabiliaceae bacterium]|nr:crossover junction endodeoxyribonuclease RuvC [Marinilabiliaceae bacterium]